MWLPLRVRSFWWTWPPWPSFGMTSTRRHFFSKSPSKTQGKKDFLNSPFQASRGLKELFGVAVFLLSVRVFWKCLSMLPALVLACLFVFCICFVYVSWSFLLLYITYIVNFRQLIATHYLPYDSSNSSIKLCPWFCVWFTCEHIESWNHQQSTVHSFWARPSTVVGECRRKPCRAQLLWVVGLQGKDAQRSLVVLVVFDKRWNMLDSSTCSGMFSLMEI